MDRHIWDLMLYGYRDNMSIGNSMLYGYSIHNTRIGDSNVIWVYGTVT